jgi:hypothetical protein
VIGRCSFGFWGTPIFFVLDHQFFRFSRWFLEVLSFAAEMTPNYRGWLWSLAAVAGTATAAVVVYKYATRGARDHGESESLAADAETQEGEDVDYEWLSEDEADAEQQTEQQLQSTARGRNMVGGFGSVAGAGGSSGVLTCGAGAAAGHVRTSADGAGDCRVAGDRVERR